MARVLVVGAGLAGLSAAIDASANGHHVVVLERSKKVGGRGTSQNKENFSFLQLSSGHCTEYLD